MRLRFRSITGAYSWLRQALDIVLLSKNLSWQDLRHCELDDDRRNNIVDHHYRFSVHISMRYKFQGQLGNFSSDPRVLQRREFPSSWIRCDRCICRSSLTGATNANSQYPVPSYSAYLMIKGMAFADASPAQTCRLWSIASWLDVSMRPRMIVDISSYSSVRQGHCCEYLPHGINCGDFRFIAYVIAQSFPLLYLYLFRKISLIQDFSVSPPPMILASKASACSGYSSKLASRSLWHAYQPFDPCSMAYRLRV